MTEIDLPITLPGVFMHANNLGHTSDKDVWYYDVGTML